MQLRRDTANGAWFVALLALVLASHAAAGPAPVSVHLEIRDELTSSALAVSIHRDVAPGTDALAFIESVVAVEYRSYPGASSSLASAASPHRRGCSGGC